MKYAVMSFFDSLLAFSTKKGLKLPYKVIIIVIELRFLGINMFLALLRIHFNPRYARAKMNLSRAKNIFMPANLNSIVILRKKIVI